MYKIKMLRTGMGTEDGWTVQRYYEGKEYQVSGRLARIFLMRGYVDRIIRSERDA